MGQDENVEFFMSASAYAGDEQYITRKARLVMRKARVWMTGVGRYTLESQRFCSYTAPMLHSRCTTTITPISPNITVFTQGCSDSKIVT